MGSSILIDLLYTEVTNNVQQCCNIIVPKTDLEPTDQILKCRALSTSATYDVHCSTTRQVG